MRNRILAVIGIALCAAMGSTSAGTEAQGVSFNGSNLQGVTTNGSSLQGVSFNGSNIQGVSPNGSNVQGISPNGSNVQGIQLQGALRNGTADSRAAAPSTGLELRGVHVVGGQLLSGDAPSRAPRKARKD
jgi:uncharacterized protein YjbI with pentapeptide repeats